MLSGQQNLLPFISHSPLLFYSYLNHLKPLALKKGLICSLENVRQYQESVLLVTAGGGGCCWHTGHIVGRSKACWETFSNAQLSSSTKNITPLNGSGDTWQNHTLKQHYNCTSNVLSCIFCLLQSNSRLVAMFVLKVLFSYATTFSGFTLRIKSQIHNLSCKGLRCFLPFSLPWLCKTTYNLFHVIPSYLLFFLML